MEELDSILPDTSGLVGLELEEGREEVLGEAVAALPGKQGGEMVNADHINETLMPK